MTVIRMNKDLKNSTFSFLVVFLTFIVAFIYFTVKGLYFYKLFYFFHCIVHLIINYTTPYDAYT